MNAQWYALHVKPNKEKIVNDHLEARAFNVFYPRLKVKPVNPRSRKERPFFAGYLFVELDLSREGNNALRWIEGAHGLVTFGGQPLAVPADFIRCLQERIVEIEAAGGLVFERLRPGDRVYIKDGALAGHEAIFDRRLSDRDRVQVLLAYLRDRNMKVRLPAAYLEKRKGVERKPTTEKRRQKAAKNM